MHGGSSGIRGQGGGTACPQRFGARVLTTAEDPGKVRPSCVGSWVQSLAINYREPGFLWKP